MKLCETNPCARSASSKLRAQGSKSSEITKRSQPLRRGKGKGHGSCESGGFYQTKPTRNPKTRDSDLRWKITKRTHSPGAPVQGSTFSRLTVLTPGPLPSGGRGSRAAMRWKIAKRTHSGLRLPCLLVFRPHSRVCNIGPGPPFLFLLPAENVTFAQCHFLSLVCRRRS